MKSIQNSLNELFTSLALPLVTNAAFSKARHNLSHTAFIELNQKTLVETIYTDDYQRFHGLRLLAIDGSKIKLPNSDAIRSFFGVTRIKNQTCEGEYVCALASVLYDVSNGVALHAQLLPSSTYEGHAAFLHIPCVQKDDLVIFDRGYCSYNIMDMMAQTKGDFLIRGHANNFKVVNEMLRGEGPCDITVVLNDPKKHSDQKSHKSRITIRFIRVVLDTGEIEVLATSLLDMKKYPTTLFKELYWKRWGIELFYGKIKTCLCLENFGGLSVESILQEFYATIFITGLGYQLTLDADYILAEKDNDNVQQVNHATAFNAIKNHAFDLLASDLPLDTVLDELTALFLKRPLVIAKNKSPSRKQASATHLLNFWKRVRKSVF